MLKSLSILLALTCAPATAATAAPPEQAGAAVRAPLESYLRGQATGVRSHYEAAFHPDAELFGMRDGKLVRMTSKAFFDLAASGKAAPDEASRRRRIADIDVTGGTAVAKLVLDYPNVRYTDYMSLVRLDGRWWIVNKTYMTEPKQARPPGR